ncbi:MAG: hypothetical protein HWE27_11690 [Gammaproteobacteria bacterium]|nr:hypothetical protein [Gammaproteobacteria bacterium]
MFGVTPQKLSRWSRLVAGSSLLLAAAASADVQINGFANIVAGSTFDDENVIREYDEDLGFERDSLFGVQFTSDLSDGLSATVQMVARGRDGWETDFTWAYMTYEFSDSSSIQFGRIRIPFYRYSEFLEVGYAYHWVTPPTIVYDIPINNQDGIAYNYNSTLGSFDTSLQLVVGRFNEPLKFDTSQGVVERPSDGVNNTSFIYSLTDFTWNFRFGYTVCSSCYLGLPTDGVIPTLASAGFSNATFVERVEARDDQVSFSNFGIRYTGDNWFAEAEVAKFQADDSMIAETTDSSYLSIGYTTDTTVWHITYEVEEADPRSAAVLLEGLIPTSDPNYPVIAGTTQAFANGFAIDTESVTFGVRYDFHPSAAYKIDFAKIDDNLTGESINLITTGISLVF